MFGRILQFLQGLEALCRSQSVSKRFEVSKCFEALCAMAGGDWTAHHVLAQQRRPMALRKDHELVHNFWSGGFAGDGIRVDKMGDNGQCDLANRVTMCHKDDR